MPTKARPGVRALYVELPEELAERLQALAAKNLRKIKAEVTLAIRAHLDAAGLGAADKPAKGRKGKGDK
jgi:hypothetical protein